MLSAELPAMVDALLTARRRALQPGQRAALLGAAQQLPVPMYVQLICEEAAHWPASLDPPPRPPPTLAEACDAVLARLERFHGVLLLRCALGLVEAAAGGLAEAELLDCLNQDQALMADVLQYHQPVPLRFPGTVWMRLRADLAHTLAECASAHDSTGAGGSGPATLRLFHRQLRQAARIRYLGSDGQLAARARAIVGATAERLDGSGDRSFSTLLPSGAGGSAEGSGGGSVRPEPQAVQAALLANSRQLQNLLVALLDSSAWTQLDAWLTDLDVLGAALRLAQLGSSFVARLVADALAKASSAPSADGEEASGVLRLPRLCAFVLLCRPQTGPQPTSSFFVLPWEPLEPGSAWQATRQRGTHCVHVASDMRWHCFDKPFSDYTAPRVTMPHKWRRPANAHTVIHKPAAVGGRGAGPPPGAPGRPGHVAPRPAGGSQADEEPHLPPVVRQLRQRRTLQHASMLVPANNPIFLQHL
ncbi:hypothetical protein T492DRAFT_294226 [Pavlovales sp. CCMP2436]|nr:hypothetical protein T492DRAFT_294226 [Pavlovales sp. CCMP2436]